MTLTQLRQQWEKKAKPLLTVVNNVDGYKTIYVIADFTGSGDIPHLRLNRYFLIGDKWEISVDFDYNKIATDGLLFTEIYNKQMEAIFAIIDAAFKRYLPE